MKRILLVLAVFGSLYSSVSGACKNGDTSKVLLVIAESEDGEEKAVIGEIRTSDNNVKITRAYYRIAGMRANWIYVDYFGKTYSFNRLSAHESGFCFKAIFAE